MRKAQEYKDKLRGIKSASLEDQMIALASRTGWKLTDIYEMSLRKFLKAIRILDNTIHYEIYLSASLSGMVEFKDKSFIKHWLTDTTPVNPYQNVTVDLEAMQSKIASAG